MNVGKTLIDAAIKNGSICRIDELLSASQLLLAEAHCLIDESIEIAEANHLKRGEIHKAANLYLKAADNYFKVFGKHVVNEKLKMAMFRDLDEFDGLFRTWNKLPKNWQPKEVTE